ncbi:uncharacterized protein cfap97d2 isoform X2 [Danio rerio]|uniref:Uncharacterized protein cfap97d2 isoform X2 n=1 Tax=Danio rerio TaxID=7955 RepID=A0A8M2BF76_DANRE|nr:uncharacterized protein si:dkey-83m22.7 isoform X2 [Danio rerio]|eukprot:XP_005167839.1 uncharacterized protein si:dkey-83m22.7 isoform X2 [Danio rerio]
MQHQAYQPVVPCVNKYLQYRWDKNCYEIHRDKVKSAKPTINTSPPKTYSHLLVKLKKSQVGLLIDHQMSTFTLFCLGSEKKTTGTAPHHQRESAHPPAFVDLQAALQRSGVAGAVAQAPGAHGGHRQISAFLQRTGVLLATSVNRL